MWGKREREKRKPWKEAGELEWTPDRMPGQYDDQEGAGQVDWFSWATMLANPQAGNLGF